MCRTVALAVLAVLPCGAMGQEPARTRVETQGDLPRFSYPVTGTVGQLLLSDTRGR